MDAKAKASRELRTRTELEEVFGKTELKSNTHFP